MHDSGDGALDFVDSLVGRAIERAMAAHHRRRLARLGWSRALDPTTTDLWVPGYPPARAGNDVRVHVLQRQRRHLPPTHRLARLPHLSRRSARLLGPLQGIVVDG